MSASTDTVAHGPIRWFPIADLTAPPGITDRCTPEAVRAAVAHIEGVDVTSVTVNTSGRHDMEGGPVEGLPNFCDVRLRQISPGGHLVEITVWVPLAWNGRFMGTAGGGNRTRVHVDLPDFFRIMTLPRALINGFAAASTDGGNRDERLFDWGLDVETGDLDWELIQNWVHRSTHDMTIIGKAVVEGIHGSAPSYSYFQGTSGGGRQALMEAQRYPDDYDGIWATDPAINWSRFIPAEIWPALVMKEYGNPLAPSKLETFRQGVIAAGNRAQAIATSFVTTVDPPAWDPYELVGTSSEAGEITATDATVMQKIWEGPRSRNGDIQWFGLRPGTESWGMTAPDAGLAVTTEANGTLAPVPFPIAKAYIGGWLLRDSEWDWTTLTFEQFDELLEQSVREFSELDTDDPDLTGLRDNGGKLLITHGLDDEVIFPMGTVHYVQRVHGDMGGVEGTAPFLRLFLSPGDGHSHAAAAGPGVTLAGGMAALMDWVENGHAPNTLAVERHNLSGGPITMTGSVDAYRQPDPQSAAR
ncbi:tannase/feruloyl esterase family alpha/beta hydrolase [Streptomyces phaeochromogenes]|uniref:tannase/feruloyl esterase family alpha/beta hydrolase n=1 Tax=Streptomyces phaeochromogenes TaxID=1923 RepID=UPI002DDA5A0A|nr:tannase/feruloyl esterase family alpha/beta hydrolase [Streptomyces phaeochromogenes]WRZ34660.1 tannase/feruloyl esterase family alpha/beta hydrolase [Streptomyces phaeochromogenes]